MAVEQNLSKLVFNRLSNEKYHELKTSGKLDDEEFYITPDLDTNPGLIQDYISNAIIKIPQHINLELSTDGTLTLKAGSIIYVPNSVGIFNEVIIDNDLILTTDGTATGSGWMTFYDSEANTLSGWYNSEVYSGNTAPTTSSSQYGVWYDTTNNIIKTTSDNGTSWSGKKGLPFCTFTMNNGTITSIDQVFNGFGYIGAVAFVLPGVQAIIPNGFNKDSKLNNYTAVVERVLTKDYAADGLLGQNLPLTLTNSPLLSAGNMIYVEEENQMYKDSISELNKRTEIEIAKITTDSTKITSLIPQPVYNCILSSAQVYELDNKAVHKNIDEAIPNRKTFIATPILNNELWLVDTTGKAPDNPPNQAAAYGTLRWIVNGTEGSTAGYGNGQELWRMQPVINSSGNFSVASSYQYGNGEKPIIWSFGCAADGSNPFFVIPTPPTGDNSTRAATTAWVTNKTLKGYDAYRSVDCSGETTVNLLNTDEIIGLKILDNTTITFDTTQLTFPKYIYTVQFYVWFPNGAKTISLETNMSGGIIYLNGLTPDFSTPNGHWLVARTAYDWTQLTISDAGYPL